MTTMHSIYAKGRQVVAICAGTLFSFAVSSSTLVAQAQGTAVNNARNFLDRAQSSASAGGIVNTSNAPINPFSELYRQMNANLGSGGTDGFVFIANQLIQAAINIVSLLAVVFVLASGIQMILNSNSEEQAKKQTVVIFNVIAGVVIMNIARFAIAWVAPDTSTARVGEILNRFDTLDDVRNTAIGFSTQIVFPLLDFALSFLAGVAILYIVYAGLSIILARGEEAKITEARGRIIKVVVGIVIILLNKAFVGVFYGNVATNTVGGDPSQDLKPDLQQGIDLAFNIANYALSFMGLIAVVALIYGGILVVTGGDDEGKRKKGIKVLQYVLYGIVMAMSAYTLTSAIIGATIRAA